MRSVTTFNIQYAHRFYGFRGEAQYLHGHTGIMTNTMERCPLCGVALDKEGHCYKCGYSKD